MPSDAFNPDIVNAVRILEVVFFGLFGAIIGSFLNACIYRLPREISIIKKSRSFCPECKAQIAWYDNIPIVSYVILRGRCRSCGKGIPLRYLLVELITACGFALVACHCRILNGWGWDPGNAALALQWDAGAVARYLWGWGHTAAIAYLLAALVLVTFIDLEHRIIPNEVTISGIIVGPVLSVAFPTLHQYPLGFFASARFDALAGSLMGILLGGGHIWLLGLFGRMLFRKEAMGFGDVKLMAMVGGIMGWFAAVMTTPLAACVGSVIGIIVVLRTKSHYLPFGPFLAMGTVMMIFWGALVFGYFGWALSGAPVTLRFRMPLVPWTEFGSWR